MTPAVRIRDRSNISIDLVDLPSAGGTVRALLYHTRRPAACVVLCHGYSASKHNVDLLAYHLAIEGYIALAIDFQGHKLGASSLPLARADDLLENALDAVAFAKAQPLVGRIVLGGHSMGAATAIGAAARSFDVAGVIAMCTSLKRGDEATSAGLAGGLINRAAYVDGASPREITTAMDRCTAQVADLAPRPLLVIAAAKDALVAPSAVRQLFDAAAEPKTYEVVDATHTDCAERARFAVVRWLRATGFEYAHD
jgi:alpha-beta hydrolase superfamily lysophospholipase